jgi:CelD/BcsL family acetyltransferase involved in cellulose biosynthesis
MNIEAIRTPDAWSALASDWNALLQASHLNLPFLTYEFQRAWWQHLGGGEWTQAELNLLVGRGEDGEIIGIAPLFRSADAAGKPALYLIGSHEIADFLDLIARPQDLDAFCAAVIAHLQDDADWGELTLYNLLDESATAGSLRAAAEAAGLMFSQETLQASPYIPLPKSFDEYVDSLDSKQAHELRRKLRKAGRNPAAITTELVTDAAALDGALADFFALMAQEADKADFLAGGMRAQMDAIGRAAFAGGWLQLFFLKVGDERAAGYLNFDYQNRIWGYNAGFNNTYASLSPGWLVMAEMIRWCIEQGREVFDFMRGDEEYKYRFGGKDRFVTKVVVRRS